MVMATGPLSANVNIGGDVGGLRKALDDGRARLSSFANEAKGALGRIDSGISELGTTLSTLKNVGDQLSTALNFIGFAGAAAGVVAVYRQVAASAKEWAEAGEQARNRGITVEFMSELRFAAEELGTETRIVNDAMDKFRVKMAEIRAEGSKSAESLKALNEPLLQSLRAAPDQRSALFAAANAIKSSGSAAEQAAIATELFGSANVSMIHVLSQGEKGLDTWAKAARNAGVVMDTETAESAKRLTKALEEFGRSPTWQLIERQMIDFARNYAVIVEGSAQAMNDAELSRAIEVTEKQLGRLEAAVAAPADKLKVKLREVREEIETLAARVGSDDHSIWYTFFASRDEDTKNVERLKMQARLIQEAIDLIDAGKADQVSESISKLIKSLAPTEADAELGVGDQLSNRLRTVVNDFGKSAAEIDQLMKIDPASEVQKKIEETKQRLAELLSLQKSRAGEAARKDAIALKGADTAGAGAGAEAAPDYSKSEAFLADLNKRTLTAQQNMFALLELEREKDLDKLEKYLADGTIRTEDAAKARFQIEEKYQAELAKIREKSIQPFVNAISNDLDRAFQDWIERGQISWEALANQILADIARIALRQAVLEPLFGGGSSGGTGLVGQAIGGLTSALQFHEGGLVGRDGQARMVSPSVFASARRMHDGGMAGLRSGEVPAILQRGEIVLPKDMVQGAGRVGPSITFNVQTPDVEGFRRSEGQITAMLTRAVARGQRNM